MEPPGSHYSVSFDRDFYAVFKAWASHSVGPLKRALNFAKAMRLDAVAFNAGYAHSFKFWNAKRELAATARDHRRLRHVAVLA